MFTLLFRADEANLTSAYFSDGLGNQPPTSLWCFCCLFFFPLVWFMKFSDWIVDGIPWFIDLSGGGTDLRMWFDAWFRKRRTTKNCALDGRWWKGWLGDFWKPKILNKNEIGGLGVETMIVEQYSLQTNIVVFLVEYMAREWLWNKWEENQQCSAKRRSKIKSTTLR